MLRLPDYFVSCRGDRATLYEDVPGDSGGWIRVVYCVSSIDNMGVCVGLFSRDRATITAGEYGGDFPVVLRCASFGMILSVSHTILGRGRTGREGGN